LYGVGEELGTELKNAKSPVAEGEAVFAEAEGPAVY
jgi:hypothetical protein